MRINQRPYGESEVKSAVKVEYAKISLAIVYMQLDYCFAERFGFAERFVAGFVEKNVTPDTALRVDHRLAQPCLIKPNP